MYHFFYLQKFSLEAYFWIFPRLICIYISKKYLKSSKIYLKSFKSSFLKMIYHLTIQWYFMHKYIERIVNIRGDDNYSYWVVSGLHGRGEENHFLVRQQVLKELTAHREFNTLQYGKKNILMQFTVLLFLVLAVLHQSQNGCTSPKWAIL